MGIDSSADGVFIVESRRHIERGEKKLGVRVDGCRLRGVGVWHEISDICLNLIFVQNLVLRVERCCNPIIINNTS